MPLYSSWATFMGRNLTFLTLLLCVFLQACWKSYDYEIEDAIYKCFKAELKEKGYDIESKIQTIENLLIHDKILNDRTGESYVSFFKKIITGNRIDLELSENSKKELNQLGHLPSDISCNDSSFLLDTNAVLDSKFWNLAEAFDSIVQTKGISPELVGTAILTVLEPKDFEHPYYKTFCLTYFVNHFLMFDYGIIEHLPASNPKIRKDTLPKDSLFVYVTKNDNLLIDQKQEKVDNLYHVTKTFILRSIDSGILTDSFSFVGQQKVANTIIIFSNDRGTNYDMYIKVQNELVKAHKELRDEFSVKLFGTNYDKLEKEQQKVLKKIIPMRISETEPN